MVEIGLKFYLACQSGEGKLPQIVGKNPPLFPLEPLSFGRSAEEKNWKKPLTFFDETGIIEEIA